MLIALTQFKETAEYEHHLATKTVKSNEMFTSTKRVQLIRVEVQHAESRHQEIQKIQSRSPEPLTHFSML